MPPRPDPITKSLLKQQMFEAVMGGDLPRVKSLLAKGATVNMTRGSKSLLARAFELKTSEVARFLLEAGAPVTAAAHNTSILGLALDRKFHDLLPLLAQGGCSFTEAVSAWSTENAAGRMAKNQDSQGLLALRELGVPLIWGQGKKESSDHPGPTVAELWVGHVNPKKGLPSQWPDTYRMLLDTEPEGNAPEQFAYALGKIHLSRWSPEEGQALVEGFYLSRWSRPAARGILAAGMIYQRRVQPALAILQTVPPNTWEELGAHTGFYANPLHELLNLFDLRKSKPAHIRQHMLDLDQLLGMEFPTRIPINGLPPWVVAIGQEGVPWSVVAKLLPEHPEKEVIEVSQEQLRIHSHLKFWRGKPAVHYLSQHGRPSMIKEFFLAHPSLLQLTDEEGLTPLLRSVTPVSYFQGLRSNLGNLVPVLEAFQDAGSDLRDCSPAGDNLVHLLGWAAAHQAFPSDATETFLLLLHRHPHLFHQTNNQGKVAANELVMQPFWGNLEVVQRFIEHQRLDALLEPASSLLPNRKTRL